MDMAAGWFEARRLVVRLKPAAVVGFGGYPSIPTVLAASQRDIPVVLHEQNALLGRANRWLGWRAQAIATSFAEVARMPKGIEAVLTGNPVRPGILPVRDVQYNAPASGGRLSVLVTGGSQGAHVFSEVVPAAAGMLGDALKARLSIVQQCRPEDIEAARAAFAAAGVAAELSTFFSDMPQRLAAAQLVIGRSGASTLAELAVAGRPAILVPYPFATDDHQVNNAEAFANAGGGWVIPQRGFTPKVLAERLEEILKHPETLAAAAAAARAAGRPDASKQLADLVAGLAASREGSMRPFKVSAQRPDYALAGGMQ